MLNDTNEEYIGAYHGFSDGIYMTGGTPQESSKYLIPYLHSVPIKYFQGPVPSTYLFTPTCPRTASVYGIGSARAGQQKNTCKAAFYAAQRFKSRSFFKCCFCHYMFDMFDMFYVFLFIK